MMTSEIAILASLLFLQAKALPHSGAGSASDKYTLTYDKNLGPVVKTSCTSGQLSCSASCIKDSSCGGYEVVAGQCKLISCDQCDTSTTATARAYLKQRCGIMSEETKEDCKAWLDSGYTADGIYNINPVGCTSFPVYCDMTTDGGGWTVFQRRVSSSVNFERGIHDFTIGFGDLDTNHWLGLNAIYNLTESGSHELRINMVLADDTELYAQYSNFYIGQSPVFTLHTSGYTGTAGDSFVKSRNQNGMGFSTIDHDVDAWAAGHCAKRDKGAWWLEGCGHANLNAPYKAPGSGKPSGTQAIIHWTSATGSFKALKATVMMVRRKKISSKG